MVTEDLKKTKEQEDAEEEIIANLTEAFKQVKLIKEGN
jgi:hypothetical protein